ncbi:DUF4340 domain-containing protein [Brachyspira sp. SAP_772]|uniref:DUF4340 domain-containing protein n=1 Tax=Brachyspira sp. SAP_772 TaxID=2608385 RepID=UPI0012F4B4FC|nr:DUF4340 domain-containing protein [Brachyspira sp. SAP_772]
MANIQKKYIILSSIVVVLAVILILTVTLKNKGYSLPQLKAINTQLSEITITRNGNETITIKFNDNKWTVNDKYNADTKAIESITNAFNNIQPVELLSRGNTEILDKYSLTDNEALIVKAKDTSSKEVRNIKFGMKANFGNLVYGQINNDKNVYLIGNTPINPKDIFDKTEDDLINKTISSVRIDDINKITISYNNNSYTLEKTDSTNWTKTWNNQNINQDDIYTSLYFIVNLRADGLIKDNIQRANLLYKVEIYLSDGTTVNYNIYAKTDNYEIELVNDDTRYYLLESSFQDLETKINNIIQN